MWKRLIEWFEGEKESADSILYLLDNNDNEDAEDLNNVIRDLRDINNQATSILMD